MIKENQKYLNRSQIILDLSLIAISMAFSYWARFVLLDGRVSLEQEEMLRVVGWTILVYAVSYYSKGLYKPKRKESLFKECIDVVQAHGLGIIFMMVGLYIFKFGEFSRGQLVIFFVANLVLMLLERMVVRGVLRHFRRQGYNLRHCLVVGANQISDDFISRVEKNKHWGYRIEGILDNWIYQSKEYRGYPVLGHIDSLVDVLTTRYYDMVIIALTSEDAEELGYVLSQCEKAGVKSCIIPYYYQYVPTQPYIDDLDGLSIIDTRRVPLENWLKNAIKRAFDIAFASLAILITSPVMLLSVIMIKLTSPGPVIFHQERVGLNRQPFMMYKFRSMHVQTDEEEREQWTTKDDPRKTKWGAFMRKTSIDELPQFFNVLKGDMSVVGPRPERPFFVEKFKEEVPRYMIKHQVRPGITGWAQINGYRGDTSIEERIKHDLYYIENWTFAFDLRIIFLTVFKGFINKNAY
ncbi:MAG: undecaprenyl-phosphate glucose phosphotransferase [Peptococcaceae bacterium]|nr:undecaprenyl-phosphate glucose phosphotransferase [Peptococcaceae bacterium]MBQ2994531.1 undecaprenyl-phosphate glucose phosphotransferase [Peptococcaceae bacterium]MBQ7025306.1 undecaprenyl-phosphate glucose phosphotransferase [Peptococcaceae bacterium]